MRETDFDQENFLEIFEWDLRRAVSSVAIESAFLRLPAIQRLRPVLMEIIQRGVRVCILVQEDAFFQEVKTREDNELCLGLLQETQAHINKRKKNPCKNRRH